MVSWSALPPEIITRVLTTAWDSDSGSWRDVCAYSLCNKDAVEHASEAWREALTTRLFRPSFDMDRLLFSSKFFAAVPDSAAPTVAFVQPPRADPYDIPKQHLNTFSKFAQLLSTYLNKAVIQKGVDDVEVATIGSALCSALVYRFTDEEGRVLEACESVPSNHHVRCRLIEDKHAHMVVPALHADKRFTHPAALDGRRMHERAAQVTQDRDVRSFVSAAANFRSHSTCDAFLDSHVLQGARIKCQLCLRAGANLDPLVGADTIYCDTNVEAIPFADLHVKNVVCDGISIASVLPIMSCSSGTGVSNSWASALHPLCTPWLIYFCIPTETRADNQPRRYAVVTRPCAKSGKNKRHAVILTHVAYNLTSIYGLKLDQ